MTLYEGVVGACYRHAATHVRGARVLDVFPLLPSRTTVFLESGAKSGTRLLPAFPSLTGWREPRSDDPYVLEVKDVIGRLPKCPFKDETFDVVIAFFMLKGDSRDTRLLDNCQRLLAPNGTFITAVANAYWKGLRPIPHTNDIAADELSRVMEGAFGQVEILGQRLRQQNALAMREPRYLSRLIPLRMRDSLSRLFRNRPYYPGEYDFRFTAAVEDAPVLMAIAK